MFFSICRPAVAHLYVKIALKKSLIRVWVEINLFSLEEERELHVPDLLRDVKGAFHDQVRTHLLLPGTKDFISRSLFDKKI